MDKHKQNQLEQAAEKIAKVHSCSFATSERMWLMIWNEVIPRNYTYKLQKRGRLRALWFIAAEIYQGYYPCWEDVVDSLRAQPGIGNPKPGKLASIPTAEEILNDIVMESETDSNKIGWFIKKRGKKLAEIRYKNKEKFDKLYYIEPVNKVVVGNIKAMVNTAIAVGKDLASDEFAMEMTKKLQNLGSDGFEEHVQNLLNRDGKESYRMEIANRIRKMLRHHGFQTKASDEEASANVKVQVVDEILEENDGLPHPSRLPEDTVGEIERRPLLSLSD